MSTQAESASGAYRPGVHLPRLLRTRRGAVGAIVLSFVLAVALIGPLVAPHPIDAPVGPPGSPPGDGAPLGTDFLGRDVLSRLLVGGFPLLWQSVSAVLLTYAIGVTVGMVAAFSRSWIDALLMRGADIFIAFPPLLLLLVLVAGAGSSPWVIVVGLALVFAPGVARIARTATLKVSKSSFVEAAVARGEPTTAIMRREMMPHIMPALLADAGVRFLWAIFITASLNFIGVGARPPAANWGLMIAENRQVLSTNVCGVLAPGLMLAMLTISVNLVADAHTSTRDRAEAD